MSDTPPTHESQTGPVELDEQGIPILQEVVVGPDPDLSGAVESPDPPPSITDNSALKLALQLGLEQQLEQLAQEISHALIEELEPRLKKRIRKQLKKRLSAWLEQALPDGNE